MMPTDPQLPARLLLAAIKDHSNRLLIGMPRVVAASRQNDKRPAQITISVPDEVVKSIRGTEQRPGVPILVFVPGDVLEEMESPIVRPGVA